MTKDLPSPELLRKILRYDPQTGFLFWLERDADVHHCGRTRKIFNTQFSGLRAFTAISGGYLQGSVFNKTFWAHRVAWTIFYGEYPNFGVDHINGCTIDNRIINLRDVALSINAKNQRKRRTNTSGFNGVHFDAATKKWRASITVDGSLRNIGRFSKIEDAVLARKSAELGMGFSVRHGK